MTEDNDKLDNIYRDSFNDYELPVSDKVLLNIKQELEEKRKRKLPYWKWIFVTLFLTAGATIFIFLDFETKNKHTSSTSQEYYPSSDPNKNSITVIENKNENKNSSKQIEDSVVKDNSTTSSTTQSSEKIIATENTVNTEGNLLEGSNTLDKEKRKKNQDKIEVDKAKDQITQQSNTSVLQSIQKKRSPEISNKKEKSTIASKKNNNSIAGNKENKKSKIKSIPTQAPSENSDQIENKTIVSKKGKDLSMENKQKKDDHQKDSIKTIKETAKLIPENKSADKSVNTKSDTLVSKLDSVKTENNLITADTLKKNGTEKSNTDQNTITDKNCFFLELNGGPSLSYRLFSGNNSSVASRNNFEKNQLNYNLGIDFGVVVKNKYILSLGIGIENKGEQYSFPGKKQMGSRFDSIPIYDTTGTIIAYNIDTIPTELFFPEYKTQNKYQFIKIPIMIGYCFSIKEKWNITPIVGVNINYLLSASSSWFDPETNQIVNYNKSNKSFSSISIAGRIKLNIGMNITDKWSISIQPGYTRFLQSIYRKNNAIKLYPYSYDLNVGLRYKF
ncbi:MAG: hypothetical protein H0W84_01165 [Bacteroidetes bacterium]|nr:hypothetical protein [Bacteroidota bacterium]